MKLLFIINNLDNAGAQNFIYNVAIKLKKDYKYNIELYLLKKTNKLFSDELNIYYPRSRRIYSIRTFFHLFFFLKKNNYDCIHVNLFPSLYYLSILSKLLIINSSTKLIYTEHSTFNNRRKYYFLKPIEKFIYKSYDELIGISEVTSKELIKWLGKKFTPLTIENGIDLNHYNYSYKLKKSSHTIDIGMVANFTRAKDHATLVKSMIFLPTNFKLKFVGKGTEENKIKQLVKNLKLDNRVSFLGSMNDIKPFLATLDFFVLSSNWEGFGLSALEAMAMGVPTLVSNLDSLKELVRNENLEFEKNNPISLSEKIMHIYKFNKFNELSSFVHTQSRRFSLDDTVIKLRELYERK